MTTSDEDVRKWLELAGPRPEVAEERSARVRAAVHAAWRENVDRARRRRQMIVGGFALAAAASLALVVLLRPAVPERPVTTPTVAARVIITSGTASDGSGTTLRANDAIVTGQMVQVENGLATLSLVNGGALRIDRGSVLSFEREREVRLVRGAVYVDVGSSAATGRFAVRTPMGTVRDIGTRFEVRLDGSVWFVRVREGLVRLERTGETRDARAGRQLIVRQNGAVDDVPLPPFDSSWDWTTRAAPPFQIEGATLSAFLDWVAAEGGRAVGFADAAVARAMRETRLHGSINGLTPDEALAVVLPTCGLAHRIDGDRIVVFKP